ncbi:MAG TPA: GyrI-like domain-containing protein, partial [Nannocystaceae bacterium]|nr:GyrI-like domain-containing protein [Nannocystaceae bacterium]
PYAAVRMKLLRTEIADIASDALARVSTFLDSHHIAAQGPALIRYLVVDYADGDVEVDIGYPIGTHAIPADEQVRLAMLPAGVYATTTHRGDYGELVHTTAKLLDSAQREGFDWADEDDHGVTRWGGRVEHYLAGPPVERDAAKWRTEIAILTRNARAS